MEAVETAALTVGVAGACDALNVSRATYYRQRAVKLGPRQRRRVPRRLSEPERAELLGVLHEPRFADKAPAEVYATLLDEGRYLASISTMYRVLHEAAEVRERRAHRVHPAYATPELLAEGPNQVWSWDITKLKGPQKWSYFHLYVIIDIFSRYVVGWMVAPRESAQLAQRLLATTCQRQGIAPDELTIHADRGSSMTSKPVAFLLADLGITKTHSRPQVSNDNPYSEAQFRTLKYQPDFPDRFGSIEDARAFAVPFFDWYNTEHHHSGLALLTPHDVHHGLAAERVQARTQVLHAAYAVHPERFPKGIPTAKPAPTAAWINRPLQASTRGTGAPHGDDGEPGCAVAGHPCEPERRAGAVTEVAR